MRLAQSAATERESDSSVTLLLTTRHSDEASKQLERRTSGGGRDNPAPYYPQANTHPDEATEWQVHCEDPGLRYNKGRRGGAVVGAARRSCVRI